MLPKYLKRLAGFGGEGMRGSNMAVTNLQMQTYITVHSFEYARNKHGQPYGCGITRYAVTEDVLGAAVRGAYHWEEEPGSCSISKRCVHRQRMQILSD